MNGKIASPQDITFGQSIGPCLEINTRHWDGDGLIPRRRRERKGWVYAATLNEDFFAAMAIVDAGYAGTGFAYFYDRKTGVYKEEKISQPLAFSSDFMPSLKTHWLLSDSKRQWQVTPAPGKLICEFQKEGFSIKLELDSEQPGLNAVCPSQGRPFNFTFKNVLLDVHTEVKVGDTIYSKHDKSGSIDFSFGYPPRKTNWYWASLMGKTEQGRPFGLNLVALHNDGLENAVWFNDTIIPTSLAEFTFESPIEKTTTRIQTSHPTVDLVFTPEGCRREKLNLLFITSDFVQPFGSFEGRLKLDGKTHKVQGVGVIEDHHAVW